MRSRAVELAHRGGTSFPHGPLTSVDRVSRPLQPERGLASARGLASLDERLWTSCLPRAGGGACGVPATLSPPPAKARSSAPWPPASIAS